MNNLITRPCEISNLWVRGSGNSNIQNYLPSINCPKPWDTSITQVVPGWVNIFNKNNTPPNKPVGWIYK